jgi:hypothetical protein
MIIFFLGLADKIFVYFNYITLFDYKNYILNINISTKIKNLVVICIIYHGKINILFDNVHDCSNADKKLYLSKSL